MLLNSLGVPDEVFKIALDNALKNLKLETVVFNLYESAMKILKRNAGGNEPDIIRDMNIFFGPSKVFIPIFKHALIKITASEIQFNNENDNPYEYRFRIEHEPIFKSILNNMVLG